MDLGLQCQFLKDVPHVCQSYNVQADTQRTETKTLAVHILPALLNFVEPKTLMWVTQS